MHVSADFKIWRADYPKSESGEVKRRIDITALPSVTVTEGVELSGTQIGSRQASFTVTNHSNKEVDLGRIGLAVRDPRGGNRDAWWQEFKVPANSTKTHTVNLSIDMTGLWSFEITSYKNGQWSSQMPMSDSSSIVRRLVVDIK